MNKIEYTNWIKKADVAENMSVVTEIQQYPYCMLFQLIRTMKINTAENRAKLAVLYPDRKRLQTILNQSFTNENNAVGAKTVKKKKEENIEKENIVKETVAEIRDKDSLMEILQKRLAELNNSSHKIEEDLEEPIYEPQPSVSLDELVEKFNNFPPKISLNPENFDNENQYKDLGKSSVFERTNIVSETLAELYIKQGAYDKAIKIYEVLKIRYPEKSCIFAEKLKSINDNKK